MKGWADGAAAWGKWGGSWPAHQRGGKWGRRWRSVAAHLGCGEGPVGRESAQCPRAWTSAWGAGTLAMGC